MVLAFTASMAVDVTFRVDMSFQTVPPEGVHIAGSFQGWDPGATQMTLTTNNIYEYTHTFTAGDNIEYKYVNGDEWGEDESVPPACAQNNNRFLIVPETDTTLVAVCFGSCDPCGDPVDITFQVDMSEETVSPDGIHVAGTFQGWNPGSTEMTDMGNSLYAITVTLSAGEYIEFKYINGNAWSGEESVPPACGVDNGVGGYNRYYTVPNANTTLNVVCFSSCNPCGYIPVEVDVTFLVDMSKETVSPDGVHLAGSLQGWDPAATEMADIGNGLYSVTLPMLSSEYHEYKFINGTTWDVAEAVPEECGADDGQGGYNRYITVPEVDTTTLDVCFGSCEPCVVGWKEIGHTGKAEIINYPNPFKGSTALKYYLPENSNVRIQLYNAQGGMVKTVRDEMATAGEHSITLTGEDLPAGLYLCTMEYEAEGRKQLASRAMMVR